MGSKHIVIDARVRRSSTGRYASRLVEHLQNIDAENRYTILVEPDDDWQMTNPNFTTVTAPFQQFSFNPLQQLGFAWQLYRLKPDLVNFTMTQQPLLYFGTIATTTHDLTMLRMTRPSRFHPLVHKLGVKLLRFLYWQSHRKSKTIIVPTNYVAKDISSLHPFSKDKIVVTYEASEPPLPGASEALDGVSKPFIMHVGAPFPHKNLERLMQAFAVLKKDTPELLLVLPGKMKNEFKADYEKWLSQNEHKDSIVAPGFVSDMELKWLYENAECYVLPSLSEGFGLPGLEAMVHGCPVASSNATCLPEVYEDAALYFDPHNVDDMARVVHSLISDPALRKRQIKRGHNQVKKYSWQKMAQETLAVYKNCL